MGQSALGVFGLFALSPQTRGSDTTIFSSFNSTGDESELNPLYPTTSPEAQREVVGAAHGQFEKVKELVTARPELAKASWDWGFGDVETALGAAAHMGRKDIAEFLIEQGARPDIFTFAMLGKLNTVKSMIEDMPGIQKIRGPHGFTLLFHAQIRIRWNLVEGAEKEKQEALVAYLTELGDADTKATSLDISEEEQKVYLGKYSFGQGANDYFDITLNQRGTLFMSRGDYVGRALLRVDTHTFAPGGAPSVQIAFDVVDGKARSVTVLDPVPIVKATRTAG